MISFGPSELPKTKLTNLALAMGFFILGNSSAFSMDEKQAQKTFKKCASCHSIGEGAKNKAGPQLNGLNNRVAGSIGSYKFSNSMKRAGHDGLQWNQETLAEYLLKPRAYIKGARMSFAGLKKQGERENLVSWLLAFDANGITHFEQTAQSTEKQMLGQSATILTGDIEFGEYLSGECVTCHQLSGNADGIPSIIGWSKEHFIHAMYEYKTEVRENPAMRTVSKRLGDEDLAALAAYFGSLH